jgi:hypothetical protein
MEEVPSDRDKKEMEKEFEKPVEAPPIGKDVNGVSEAMTRNEEETEEKTN